jgi:hypothetical protein
MRTVAAGERRAACAPADTGLVQGITMVCALALVNHQYLGTMGGPELSHRT